MDNKYELSVFDYKEKVNNVTGTIVISVEVIIFIFCN